MSPKGSKPPLLPADLRQRLASALADMLLRDLREHPANAEDARLKEAA